MIELGEPVHCPICGSKLENGYKTIRCGNCLEPYADLCDLSNVEYIVKKVLLRKQGHLV